MVPVIKADEITLKMTDSAITQRFFNFIKSNSKITYIAVKGMIPKMKNIIKAYT